MMRSRSVVATVALTLAIHSAGCQADIAERPCTGIPDGGCPGSDTSVCLDQTCMAIYTCQPDGTWTLAAPCPAHEGGTLDATAMRDVAEPHDASTDVSGAFGGPGCQDLQAPDCPLGVGLACGADCCGCVDLYVCQDGGWDLWGACLDGQVSSGD